MEHFPTPAQLATLEEDIDKDCALPSHRDVEKHHVVYWHVFRRQVDALRFARHILLSDKEKLTGGRAEDSIGSLWWLGVQVDDLQSWGNRGAVHKIDFNDPENPKSPML